MVGSTLFFGNGLYRRDVKRPYRGLFMGTGFELGKQVIGVILTSQKPYVVPPYQRDYSWDKDEVEALWKDLINCMGQKIYFLGSMVFKNEEGDDCITVIDGQQRLATLTILLSSIRDLLLEMGAEKDSWSIGNHYIIKQYEGQTEVKSLTLNIRNREYFYYCIQLPPDDKNRKKFTDYPKTEKTNQLIKKAYEFFKEEITKIISPKSTNEKVLFLNDLVKHIRATLMVIAITVDTEDEAYLIFETINDRGLELSVADLFKNYLIRKAKSDGDRDEIILMWRDISSLLDDKLRAFLRHYWVSKKEPISDRRLFGEFKNHIEAERLDVKDFVKELKDEATNYYALLNPEAGSWQDKEITSLISDFNTLSAKQCLPLLMSGQKIFNEGEFKKLLNEITNFTFRYSTICNKHNNILETKYSETAVQIREGKIKDTTQAIKNLKTIYPEDSEFESMFLKKSVEGKLGRYIIRKIDVEMGDYKGEKPDYNSCTLEHIMPQKPDDEWEKYFEKMKMKKEEIEVMTNRIGNITILDDGLNKKAKNFFFLKKRNDAYAHSIIWLNGSLKSTKKWDFGMINQRQEHLAKLACKAWKVQF